ncbi:MAG TPA: hypothetical protein VJ816_08325 [Gemmatimonadales bacterium]|nr:hypothetical protein [Gemmatimonadales bacterium]
MTVHELKFPEDLVPGWAECVQCGRTMRLREFLTTECVPKPCEKHARHEEEHHDHS